MKLTNLKGYPESIVRALQHDPYSKEGSDYTASQMPNSPRQILLSNRHEDELVEDVENQVWSLLGTGFHHVLEAAGDDGALLEERIHLDVGGRKFSGAMDHYKDGMITDYKVTSAMTKIYGSRLPEWTIQLNMLAHLVRSAGHEVTGIQIIALYRDWSEMKALQQNDYPQKIIEIIPMELWSPDYCTEWLEKRIADLKYYEGVEDNDLPECSPEEMWEKPTTYAIKKKGRKSAVRVLDSLSDIETYAIQKGIKTAGEWLGGHSLETRDGERTRCKRYCAAAPFCNQWLDHSEAHVWALKQKEEKNETP